MLDTIHSATITYNDDETVLSLLVNEKELNKYKFIKHECEQGKCDVPCGLCAFYGTNCEIIRCLWSQRKDVMTGYYIVIE